MAKKKKLSDFLNAAQNTIEVDNADSDKYIPDIITFCESPSYLDLKSKGLTLRTAQRIVLKCFYRGTKGNENLSLTPEEIDWCEEYCIKPDEDNILEKYKNDSIFRELVLVWGRRSGKDFIVAVIACYEAMKLLECVGGNPYALYGISTASPISILTIATAKDQAQIAFREIKDRVVGSPYFMSKVGPDGWESSKIHLLTPHDKEVNKKLADKKMPPNKGSVVMEVGHSNSDSLLGKSVFVLILDEVASYKSTKSSSSGERIYTAMSPSLNTFNRTIVMTDDKGKIVYQDNGEPLEKKIYDSKIISISSPRGKEGIFYDLFINAPKVKDRLACRLPTWICNPNLTEDSLRDTNSHMTEQEFMMEFGAEFSGTGGESFFPRQQVEDCFKANLKNKESGSPGIVYFAHLDPATSSHNYALAVVHKELYFDKDKNKNDYRIIVDHIKYWHPSPNKPIDNEEVSRYIEQLRRKFYLGLVTYDFWNSKQSMQMLKRLGVPSKMTHYTKRYKMIIYDELYNLVVKNKILIPRHNLLMNEMFNLQRRWTAPTGYSVHPKKEGDVITDDVCDAVAGAVYNAIASMTQHLPKAKVIEAPQSPSSGARQWNSMSGPMGYGTGQSVSQNLENHNSWPNYKR